MDVAVKLENRAINPAVINMFQFENQTTTLNFVLDSYMWEDSDLRNYIPYAVTSVNGVIDMTELTATYNENTDKLTLSWTVGDYTLSEKGAVVYQIVFKENTLEGEIGEEDVNNAVFYTYKAIIINRGSVEADNHITANYPTLLKQWLDRMNNAYSDVTEVRDNAIADITAIQQELNRYATEFTNSIFYIPYDERIPVKDRLDGRLYFQYTDGDRTKGRFEDPQGNSLIAEAKGSGSLPMFAPIWSDHLYNDASYLRADTYSWHDSSIYVTAYEKIVAEYNNENSVEQTDEMGIVYKLTPNGFKIADASQEELVLDMYLSDEKAWYYILDTENARFKLPREKKTDGKYLYFFVGTYDREEGEVNLGEMTEILNDINSKTDRLLEEMVDDLEEAKNNVIAEINEHSMINNVGDIFYTTRLDTELRGAVECNGGTYSIEDYTGEQSVGNLLANGSLPYVSLEEYESLVTTNGSCRAFGWNGGDEFRVPTVSGIVAELDNVEYRAMIVLATGVKEVSIQDYTRQLTETTNKEIAKITQASETELSKITQAGLEGLQAEIDNLKAELNTMLGRMDFANAVEVRLDSTTPSYNVPSDGYIQFSTTNANSGAIYINGKMFCHITSVSNGNVGLIPLTAGDVLSTNIETGWLYTTFIPQKGV